MNSQKPEVLRWLFPQPDPQPFGTKGLWTCALTSVDHEPAWTVAAPYGEELLFSPNSSDEEIFRDMADFARKDLLTRHPSLAGREFLVRLAWTDFGRNLELAWRFKHQDSVYADSAVLYGPAPSSVGLSRVYPAFEQSLKSCLTALEEPPVVHDPVNNPKHYNSHPSGIKCVDVIEHMIHNVGAVIKYCWRAGLKEGADEIEDLRKAEWYIKREIARREKLREQNASTK